MRFSRGRPPRPAKDPSFRCALEELKFVKSMDDLKILYQKMRYLLPMTVGALDRSANVPPSLQLEPTNHCNVNCICCSRSRSTRPRGYMDLDLFRRIIDAASDLGVKRVRLYVHGEPLLHPHIVDMIRFAKSRGLSLNLTTNGMLLDREMSEAILHSGITWADHVTFSIMGYSREVHENIMKKSDYRAITKNLFDLIHLRTELGVNGPVIQTIFHTMPENEHEEEDYVRYWRGKVDHARLGGRISVSFSEYKRGTQDIGPRERTCFYLWERMTIFWNGDVSLCCEDVDGDWILGNLREHSLAEVWNHDQMLAIRQIHREGRFREFPFCYRCDTQEARIRVRAGANRER